MPRPRLWLLALASALTGCPAAPAVAPAGDAPAPARRVATPAPTAAPSFDPARDPDVEGVKRIDRLSPWIKREPGGAIFTFIFFEKDDETVFFRLKSGIAVRYAIHEAGGEAPLAEGVVTLREDHEKFTLPAGLALPARVRWTYKAALPDRRTLVGEALTDVQ